MQANQPATHRVVSEAVWLDKTILIDTTGQGDLNKEKPRVVQMCRSKHVKTDLYMNEKKHYKKHILQQKQRDVLVNLNLNTTCAT